MTTAESIFQPHVSELPVESSCHFCIGRQPIYDAARQIRGYELLYRRLPSENVAVIANPKLIQRLWRYPVPVLVEKIETQEFHTFREWGCELFQGYYLRRPERLSGKRIPSNRLAVMGLVAECADPDCSIATAANVISRDAALCYGLLKLANSALFGGRNVRSLHGAVAALGIDRVYRWSVLMVLADLNDGPPGYLEFALRQARARESLAAIRDEPRFEAYLVGML